MSVVERDNIFGQLTGLSDPANAALGGIAARGLGTMMVTVGTQTASFISHGDKLEVRTGHVADPWVEVELSEVAWSDLVTSMRTAISLQLSGELTFPVGNFSRFARWEGALRAFALGIPAYDPSRVSLKTADGSPIDLTRSFTLNDSDEAMAVFFQATGYLHVRAVLSPSEVNELAGEADRVAEQASETDPFTWWAQRPDGTAVLCRVIYAQRMSPLMGTLADDGRMKRLANLLGTPVESFIDRMDGPTLLLKPAGELRGLSNLPWHQDCGIGGHPIMCPAVAIGVQITGSSPEVGHLEVIAGSHGQSIAAGISSDAMQGWPRVAIDTEPGDVTVHIMDVLHASPPPTGSGGRSTLYLSYYPPSLGDHVHAGEAANDVIRGRQLKADAIRAEGR